MTDRSVVVRLRLNIRDFSQGAAEAAVEAKVLSHELEGVDKRMGSVERSSSSAGKQIDRLSGRIELLGHLAAAVGPALVPIGAVGIPAVAGLTQQLGFAVLAGGTLLGAMQGVGTAVKALEKARLDPTDASIQAAQLAMEQLGPDAQQFALQVQNRVLPQLRELRDSAAAGWFPGMTESLDDFEKLAPRISTIVSRVSEVGGRLVADGAESLAGPKWDEFWRFIEDEAPKDIAQLGHTVGDLTHGLAEMWIAFGPMNNDFADGFEKRAEAFDKWATGLDNTQGFQEFSDYIKETGPQVLDFLGSTADMLIQIVEAAAPLGGPTLKILTAIADIFANIADSDLGTPLLALASLTSTLRLLDRAAGGIGPKFALASRNVKQFGADVRVASFGMDYDRMDKTAAATGRVGEKVKGLGRGALVLGGLSLAASGATDKVGLTNTTLMGMSGLMLGPWGAAVGGGVGLLMDLKDAAGQADTALAGVASTVEGGDQADLEALRARLETQLNSWQGKTNFGGMGDDLRSGIAEIDEAIGRGAPALGGMGDLLRGPFSSSVEHADQTVQQFANTFEHLNSLLQRRGSLIAYEDALDALSASIKENGNAWSFGSEKGRANLTAADTLTQQAIARANILKNAGDNEGASKMLQRTIQNLKDFADGSKAADKALAPLIAKLEAIDKKNPKPTLDADGKPLKGKTDDAKKDLDDVDKKHPKPKIDADHRIIMGKVHDADAWLTSLNRRTAIPTLDADGAPLQGEVSHGAALLRQLAGMHPITKIGADASGAFGVFSAVRNAINALDGATAVTHVRTVRDGSPGPQAHGADGLTVPGPRHPYGDRTLILAAPGEELISNRHGEADAFRADRAAGRIPAYSYGGTVGPTRWGSMRDGGAGAHTIERYTGPKTIHVDMGRFGDLFVDVATGVVEHQISESQRRESVVSGA